MKEILNCSVEASRMIINEGMPSLSFFNVREEMEVWLTCIFPYPHVYLSPGVKYMAFISIPMAILTKNRDGSLLRWIKHCLFGVTLGYLEWEDRYWLRMCLQLFLFVGSHYLMFLLESLIKIRIMCFNFL